VEKVNERKNLDFRLPLKKSTSVESTPSTTETKKRDKGFSLDKTAYALDIESGPIKGSPLGSC
jgi:hypothetical protein